jgi:hypothetical protein
MRPALSVILVLTALVPACQKSDPQKCDQALQVTRQAIEKENFSAAQQWREYAWKQCDDRSTLESLDRDLVNKRSESEARQRAADERARTKTALLKTFLTWVAENRAAPERASATPTCDLPAKDDPLKDKSKKRLCTATRTAGAFQLFAHYWEEESKLALFNVKLPDVTSCEEIGATKVLKTWQVPATQGRTTPRFRCEFASGPLAGMNAVVSQAINADLYVFEPGYVEKDPSLRPTLDAP